MLNVNHELVETFFDYLDQATLIIYETAKKPYLEALLLAVDYILNDEVSLNQLDETLISKLDEVYKHISDITFNKEEIRKAFQLALLKAFKHLQLSFSEITPDSIGIFYAYLTDLFFKNKENISILDANVGCSNLLFSLINNTQITFEKIYGIDVEQSYLNISCHLANLLEYEVEYLNQNNLTKLLVPLVDLVISDLPFGEEQAINNLDLITAKNNLTYKPYLMIENLMKYGKPGSYFIYLIPNDFFNQDNSRLIKNIILNESYLQAIIELPQDLFNAPKYQKSIMILQKKASHIKVNNEILMLSLPSFTDKEKMILAIDKINQWFKENIN